MKKIISFVKKETVFTVAIILALISCIVTRPNVKELGGFIDFRVLSILFCLMLLVSALREQYIFRRLGEKLTLSVSTAKGLEMILVLLCFFSSMIITNDVALITFVPFALALLKGAGLFERSIRVIVLQTIAANLGSMLTPIGNPQNLYLYNLSNMGFGQFVLTMLPLTLVSLILLIVIVLFGPKGEIKVDFEHSDNPINKGKLVLTAVLFIICMGTVCHVLPWYISLACVLICGIIVFRNLFKEVDYFLLGTFIGFFVFVGNMQKIPAISNMIESALINHEMTIGCALSQIISNVPASMLLSGFTTNYTALTYGVDIGGLGTLIASLASLISYKFYAVTKDSKKGRYMLTFTVWNVIFLIVLTPVGLLFLRYFG